jgi:MFS superfamily sulfate permease-like transporter
VDGLDGLLADMWARLTDLVHFAGPWGPVALSLAALLLVIGRRYRFISFPGVLLLLALAVFLLIIRAVKLGRF